jgi:hypothetical protein
MLEFPLPGLVVTFRAASEDEHSVGPFQLQVNSKALVFENWFNPHLLEVQNSFRRLVVFVVGLGFEVFYHLSFEHEVSFLPSLQKRRTLFLNVAMVQVVISERIVLERRSGNRQSAHERIPWRRLVVLIGSFTQP